MKQGNGNIIYEFCQKGADPDEVFVAIERVDNFVELHRFHVECAYLTNYTNFIPLTKLLALSQEDN